MYNLLLRESFEIRPVRRHRRTEGSVTSSRLKIVGDRTDRTRLVYIILACAIFTEVLLPSHLYCDKAFLHTS